MNSRNIVYLAVLIAFAVLMPLTVFSAQQDVKEERKIIIETYGEAENLPAVLAQVEAEMEDANHVTVFVDDEGNVNIEKMVVGEPMNTQGHDRPHRMKMQKVMAMAPHKVHEKKPPMSAEAAGCLLKNIKNANTDGAARIIRQACIALHNTRQ